MIAVSLLNRLSKMGVSVRVDGNELVLNPRHLLVENTLAVVREHGRELRVYLDRRRLEASGAYSTGDRVCGQCGRLGRVALIDGMETCSFCVVERAEDLARGGAAR